MKMNKKGFTLIEMLVVIAIIAVLVAIIVPAVGSSTIKAQASTDAANLRSVMSAATIEYATNGDLTGLEVTAPAAKSVDADSVEIYMVGDELIAYYTDGTDYYDIAAFTVVAEGQEDTTTGKTITEVTAVASKPAENNKVYPVAGGSDNT